MNCEFRKPAVCGREAVTKELGRWMCQSCYNDLKIGTTICELGNGYSCLNSFPLEHLSDTQAMELNDALDRHVQNIQALQTKIRREYIRRAEVA